jgi:hypothetical protein
MNIIRALPVLVLYFLATSFSHAALTPIGPLDFSSGVTVLDFSALADNTEANGLIVDGVLFQATKNGSSTNGVVIVDGGPGTTGNITPPNLVSLSDLNAIALIVSLPNLAIQFGYGYALMLRFLSQSVLPSNFLPARHRSVAFPLRGFPIRSSPGGYGGVASDTPFDRAVLTFSDVGDALRSIMWAFAANRASDEG